MAAVSSQRTVVLNTLLDLCAAVGGGRYFVHRGAVNWGEFDFSRYSAGIAVLTPQFTLLGISFNTMTITLEFVQRLPSGERVYDTVKGLNDEEIEGLVEDSRIILLDLQKSKGTDGSSTILRIVSNRIEGQEMANLDFSIQGVQITFSIEY